MKWKEKQTGQGKTKRKRDKENGKKQEKTKGERNKKGKRKEGQTQKEKEKQASREARRLKWRTNGSSGTAGPFGAGQSALNATKACGNNITNWQIDVHKLG